MDFAKQIERDWAVITAAYRTALNAAQHVEAASLAPDDVLMVETALQNARTSAGQVAQTLNVLANEAEVATGHEARRSA